MRVPEPRTDSPSLEEVLEKFDKFLDPPNPEARNASRICVYPSGATIPMLSVLALTKYGSFDAKIFHPMFLDGSWRNETLGNVGLEVNARIFEGREKRSGILAPAGSREYQREYQKKRYHRVKEELKKAKEGQNPDKQVEKDFLAQFGLVPPEEEKSF